MSTFTRHIWVTRQWLVILSNEVEPTPHQAVTSQSINCKINRNNLCVRSQGIVETSSRHNYQDCATPGRDSLINKL